MNLTKFVPTKAGDHKLLGTLAGGGMGFAVAQLCQQPKQLTVVITQSSVSASTIIAETRFYSGDQIEILNLPDWETLPYDNFSPHQDIISQRLKTLTALASLQQGLLVVPIATIMHRLAPALYLQSHSIQLHTGAEFNIDSFRKRLDNAGYRNVATVFEHGEYSIRGSIMDVFPMGTDLPIRIDLFDQEIDTLRTFDPDTQRSIEQIEKVELLPAKEFPLTEEAIAQFRQNFRATFDVPLKNCPIYQDISDGLIPAGIEYYLPLFYDQLSSVFDYLPEDTLIITESGLESSMDHFWQEISNRYENRRHDISRPILPPQEIFIAKEELFRRLKSFPRISLTEHPLEEKPGRLNLSLAVPSEYPIDSRAQNPLNALEAFLMETSHRVLFCAESHGRKESLLDLLKTIRLNPTELDSWSSFISTGNRQAIVVAPLERGLVLPDAGITVITESQLFGQSMVTQRRRRKQSQEAAENVVKNLTELKIDAPVVHIDHGIGRYRGLETIEVDGQKDEFLTLEYADKAKLYVPVTNLHLISRYSGTDMEYAPLSKLGTDRWSQAKRKAAEKIRDTAAELLEIYAQREAKKGHAFNFEDADYRRFAADFPFEETPDQQTAIEAVLNDMRQDRPMDRLICGDVGFGKTEVAMRAAFVAAMSGKQVAVLVPTTLLAQQHYDNIRDRLADWPIKIESLSRFKTGKESTKIIEGLEKGSIDIVVGTHKLLGSQIKFERLGLLIVDEEHRFGVQQKEKVKALRANVDILTMTATPIPRTLNMSMASIRDLSIIATPPARRLSVKTFVRQTDDALKKEAILREILRGGQVYYLHNEVKDIEKCAADIQSLVPEARVAIGHGQMSERQLERVMSDFYHKRFNVLVCTTIIETGIDIPSANTIIIDRADKFGLAQLHQLRGRVGRSHHQAYAYLLTPPPKTMTKDALKRLDAISEADDLGAGFTLATHDLEIRGAGELLGEEQSGHMETIGYSLYMEMLDRAVKAIRSGKTPDLENPLDHGAEITLHIPAIIPDDYIPDVNTRLTLYKRVASTTDEQTVRELQVEMIDRFGLLPTPVKNLFRQTLLRLKVEQLGISKIDAGVAGGTIHFSADTTIEPYAIVRMVQAMPHKFKLTRADQLKFVIESSTAEERFGTIEDILKMLTRDPNKL
ncbi:transcription-repair coupling factor [Gynuella sp.]|uniref:transcription-repair coupling factor n=1 Tax=Gynuella sp. TaxID=2969146 RepID=UPI003D0E0E34